jgi:hypothetical protein
MPDGMDMPPSSPGGEGLASALATMDAMLEPMIEATIGKRARLIELGFSEETASQMAGEYYRTLMAFLRVKTFGANG